MSGVAEEVFGELRARYPGAFRQATRPVSSGLWGADQALGGGLCPGRVSEWLTPAASSGASLWIDHLLGIASAAGQWLALVDGSDAFDPGSVSHQSWLEDLFWIRCRGAAEVVKAADILLRDEHFGFVVLDVRGLSSRALRAGVRPAAWYRLQRLARVREAVVVVLSRSPVVPGAGARLVLGAGWRLADLDCTREALRERLSFQLAGDGALRGD